MKRTNCCNALTVTEKTPQKVHYAQEKCEQCGKHLKWISNPESNNTQSTKYTIEQVLQVKRQKRRACFFCRRTEDQLGNNQTLELDHITEKQNGGEDRAENLQILCTACHKLKNHQRLYHNFHIHGRPD